MQWKLMLASLLSSALLDAGCSASGDLGSAEPFEPRPWADADRPDAAPEVTDPAATDDDVTGDGVGDGAQDDDLPPIEDLRCSYPPGAPFEPDRYWETGPYRAASLDLDFVDPTRPALDEDGEVIDDQRELKSRIHYPAADGFHLFGDRPLAEGGPFPLLIYSHGAMSSRDEADVFGEHLASHGYIVLAPTFPLSTMTANMFSPVITDVINQPADISFLIDQMLAKSALASDLFFGGVDSERIGTMGLSLGGFTTYLVTFHRDLLDPRIKAAAPIAGPAVIFTPRFYQSHPVPMMIVHGTLDSFADYELNARLALERAPSANLLTIVDGSHAGFMSVQLIMALGSVLPLNGADPSNPDGLACGAVGVIGGEATQVDPMPMLMQGLGGPEVGVEMTVDGEGAMVACAGDDYTQPAVDPAIQERLTKTALLAFFEASFARREADRQAACRFLHESLPEHPDAVFE